MVNSLAVKWVIIPAVFKLFANAAADLYAKIRGNRDIALIEEPMDIAPEKKPVADFMGPAFGIGLDMGRLQGRQGVLLGYGTGSAIGFCDGNLEGTLAEAWLEGSFFSVASPFLVNAMGFPIQVKDLLLFPTML